MDFSLPQERPKTPNETRGCKSQQVWRHKYIQKLSSPKYHLNGSSSYNEMLEPQFEWSLFWPFISSSWSTLVFLWVKFHSSSFKLMEQELAVSLCKSQLSVAHLRPADLNLIGFLFLDASVTYMILLQFFVICVIKEKPSKNVGPSLRTQVLHFCHQCIVGRLIAYWRFAESEYIRNEQAHLNRSHALFHA